MNFDYFQTPFGWLEIAVSQNRVEHVRFVCAPKNPTPNALSGQVVEALERFLRGESLHPLPFECAFVSTFSERILRELAKIPFGESISYQELGKCAGGVHQRAVARVMASNKIALLYPCHRVVAKAGIGGYSGGGAERKRAILDFERRLIQKQK